VAIYSITLISLFLVVAQFFFSTSAVASVFAKSCRDVIQETYCKVAGSASYKQITTHAGFILTDTLLVNT